MVHVECGPCEWFVFYKIIKVEGDPVWEDLWIMPCHKILNLNVNFFRVSFVFGPYFVIKKSLVQFLKCIFIVNLVSGTM